MRLRSLPVVVLLATAALASGCSGDEDDGQDGPERSDLAQRLASTFEKAAVGTGDGMTYCLALDDEGAARVAEALGVEGATFEDSANLGGSSPEDGLVQCGFEPVAGAELPVGVVVRTTDDDLHEAVAPADSPDHPAAVTERDIDGLDDGTVVGASGRRSGCRTACTSPSAPRPRPPTSTRSSPPCRCWSTRSTGPWRRPDPAARPQP